uniref:Uncharacterized protein n=1 Tax=Romanomermis culicivorax TaxID=13658 RepID=A0A915IC46_ROMCU
MILGKKETFMHVKSESDEEQKKWKKENRCETKNGKRRIDVKQKMGNLEAFKKKGRKTEKLQSKKEEKTGKALMKKKRCLIL